jgi:hypothetical protein
LVRFLISVNQEEEQYSFNQNIARRDLETMVSDMCVKGLGRVGGDDRPLLLLLLLSLASLLFYAARYIRMSEIDSFLPCFRRWSLMECVVLVTVLRGLSGPIAGSSPSLDPAAFHLS